MRRAEKYQWPKNRWCGELMTRFHAWGGKEKQVAQSQARGQVLKFGGEQYIFRGAIFLFYGIFKRNYVINFQRLTERHIASCVFSVWSHKICHCTGMLRAMGNQAAPFSNFQKFCLFLEKVSTQS